MLLEEVLDTLKVKNRQASQVDAHISDFMNPNVEKVVKAIEDEREKERKLDSSAVMPTLDPYKDGPLEPIKLLNLHKLHGTKNNKKVVPIAKNKYY